MVFALLPLGTAGAQEADPEPIGTEDVCPPPEDADTNDSDDLSDIGGVHADNIECVVDYGIAQGYPDGTYRPGESIKRDQMATFIAEYVETAMDEELAEGDNAFTDDDSNVHHENINKIAEAGIVTGRGGGLYAPKGDVSRGQMATFIANAIDYLDDRQVNGSIPPDTETNYFDDDDTNTHHGNINRIAEQGIVQGMDDGDYNASEDVTRGQMATFIMHAAEYADELGLWAPTDGSNLPEPGEEPGESNQTYTVTPQEAAENTVSTSTAPNQGARVYSVGDLEDGVTYDIALFDEADVVVDEDGVVTFIDDNNNNQADLTVDTVGGVIEVVNGSSTGAGADNHVEATPVNGTITFTIDSTTSDSVVPVFWVDEGTTTAGNNRLAVDANEVPTEEFGIGGLKTWIPQEATSGAIGSTGDVTAEDEDVMGVNKELNRIVTNDRTYFYDANDTFYVSDTDSADAANNTDCTGAGNAEFRVTMAQFEAELSVGDELDESTFYAANEELPSTFCLEDISPATPTTTADDGEGSNEVTVTSPTTLDADDEIVIIQTPASVVVNNDCDDAGTTYPEAGAEELGPFTRADDEDTTTPGIQITVAADPDGAEGQDADSGCYQYESYVVVDGEESGTSTPDTANSTTDVTAPLVTNVGPNDIDDGVGSTNQIIVTFDEPVVITDATGFVVTVDGQPFELTGVSATTQNATGTRWIVTLDGTMQDAAAANEPTYVLDVAAESFEDLEGNENAEDANGNADPADDGDFEY